MLELANCLATGPSRVHLSNGTPRWARGWVGGAPRRYRSGAASIAVAAARADAMNCQRILAFESRGARDLTNGDDENSRTRAGERAHFPSCTTPCLLRVCARLGPLRAASAVAVVESHRNLGKPWDLIAPAGVREPGYDVGDDPPVDFPRDYGPTRQAGSAKLDPNGPPANPRAGPDAVPFD